MRISDWSSDVCSSDLVIIFVILPLRSRALKPAAGEARALQSGDDRRVASHIFPYKISAMVGDHRQNRALIDAEIIGIEPPQFGIDDRMRRGVRKDVARVETVEETIFAVEPPARAEERRVGTGGVRTGRLRW